jgi:hypothetical protein
MASEAVPCEERLTIKMPLPAQGFGPAINVGTELSPTALRNAY